MRKNTSRNRDRVGRLLVGVAALALGVLAPGAGRAEDGPEVCGYARYQTEPGDTWEEVPYEPSCEWPCTGTAFVRAPGYVYDNGFDAFACLRGV